MSTNVLGRRTPTDFKHVEKYPFSAIAPKTVTTVNKILKLPVWHWDHDQGHEGACVGFGTSMMMSILNKHKYDCRWLWNEAKKVDEWPDTNPGDDEGTSVRAACDVLRSQGHLIESTIEPTKAEGITTNRWATSIDQMRTALYYGIPISIGVNWYTNFDYPASIETPRGIEEWIGQGSLGQIRGGHCVCLYGASDTRQAFRLKNNWGRNYPLVWLPYNTMQRLLNEQGEAALVVDR